MKYVIDFNNRKVLFMSDSMKQINHFIAEYYPEYFKETPSSITIAVEKLREVM